jgi:hypothetical protein
MKSAPSSIALCKIKSFYGTYYLRTEKRLIILIEK